MTTPLTEAKNLNTPHDRLRELAEESSLWMAVLSNPNTPIELAATLRKKIAGHPRPDALDAHTLELLVKEAGEQSDPGRLQWLSQYGGDVARAVARNPHITSRLVAELSASRDVLVVCELLRNPSLDAESLPLLRTGGASRHIERAVAASSKAQPELLVGLSQRAKNQQILRSIAQNKVLPLYGLISLWLDRKNWAVRLYERECATDARAQTLAPWLGVLRGMARPNVWRLPSVIAELQKGERCDATLRETLLQVSRIPMFHASEADFVKLLAGDPSVIALQLTTSYYTTTAYLSTQASHADPRVRAQVASNNRTRPEDLEVLAGDPSPAVRAAVASNYRASAGALQRLASSTEKSIRLAIARHYQAPAEVLLALSRDEDLEVRLNTARNPQTPTEALLGLAKEDNELIQLALLSHQRFPLESRAALVNSRSEKVRELLARNGSLHPEVYSTLCRDACVNVRKALLTNPSIGEPQLKSLAGDAEVAIRLGVASHPRVTTEVLSMLAKDPQVKVRLVVAEKYRANVDTLSLLAKDNSLYVRLAVAKNTKTRRTTLQRLSSDSDERVKKVAAQRLGEKASRR